MIQAEVRHRLPGRLRVRTDGLCGQAVLLRRIEQDLLTLPGVRNVTGNGTTGSLLIEYDAELQSESLLIDRLANMHSLVIAIDSAGKTRQNLAAGHRNGNPPRLAQAVQYPFDRADQILFDLTNGYLDLRYSIPVAFVLIGTWKVLRTAAQPSIPWYMYYWMSFNLFSMIRMLEEKNRIQKTSAADDAILRTNAAG